MFKKYAKAEKVLRSAGYGLPEAASAPRKDRPIPNGKKAGSVDGEYDKAPLPPQPEKTPLRRGGKVAGDRAASRLDKKARGGSNKWIGSAIRHPGALHRELGVPEGETIPAAKLEKAAHSDDPTLRRRANFAKTLKGMHKSKD